MIYMKLLAGLAATATLALASMAGAQEFTFKLHHLLSAKAPAQTQMLEPWAKAVEENSGGRVKIEIFPAMTLGGRPPELIQQARDGVVDLVWTVNGYTPGLFPRTEVMELPTVFKNDPRAANLALFDMFESDLRQEYQGVEVMFLHVHAGQGIHMRDTPVRSPADLVGTGRQPGCHAGAGTAARAVQGRRRRRVHPVGNHPAAEDSGTDQVPDRRRGYGTIWDGDFPGVDECRPLERIA